MTALAGSAGDHRPFSRRDASVSEAAGVAS